MQRQAEPKIVLIRRKTRLMELIARHNTLEQARFYIEHLGSDFSDYLAEDYAYTKALRHATETLDQLGRLQVLPREYVPNFIFGPHDIVVAIGQDGLVANTLKYLDGQPLLGLNPDPSRWDGVLLPFSAKDLRAAMLDVMAGRRPLREVTMAKATLSDGQELYAVNDLFIGHRTHVSAKYAIQSGDRFEEQSSSGVIVSTALGATGWLKSVLAGAAGVLKEAGASHDPPKAPLGARWDQDHLQFTVREPFPSRSTGASIVFGEVSLRSPLSLISHMPENGVIFSDGMENDALHFLSGVTAHITVAKKKGQLVV